MPSPTQTPLDSPMHGHFEQLVRLPGVYRPQVDTGLLCEALTESTLPTGGRVLDYCTGSGAVAIAAARCGAGRVVAVDVSTRAAVSAWVNARLRGLPIGVRRGGLEVARRHGPYDVVVANPPYVPVAGVVPTRRSRCWDGGVDGRAVLGPLCREIGTLLRPGGFALIVQSMVAGPDRTVSELRGQGLRAAEVKRVRVPFGPVMRRQEALLVSRGLTEPGQRWEEVVVIRGQRPER